MTERRRFPPPWIVEETASCFIVRDVPYPCAYLLDRAVSLRGT
jgi:hypothetical protein